MKLPPPPNTWELSFLFKSHTEGSCQDNQPSLDLGRGGAEEGAVPGGFWEMCIFPLSRRGNPNQLVGSGAENYGLGHPLSWLASASL